MKKYSGLSCLLYSFFIFLMAFACTYFGFLSTINYIATDFLYQKPSNISNQIKIIAIDEKTIAKYKTPSNWSRQMYASLVDKLNDYKPDSPSVIAFDIYFDERSQNSNGDLIFAKTCEENKNVITASNIIFQPVIKYHSQNTPYIDNLNISSVEYPYEELSSAAQSGFVNALQDADNYIRRSFVSMNYDNSQIFSFPFLTYKNYMAETGQTPVIPKTDEFNCFMFTYSAEPSSKYEVFSLCDVLDGKYDSSVFKNCIVLVGAYAAGLQDSHLVPIAHGSQMFGVEIHANIIDSLLKQTTAVPINLPLISFINAFICSSLYLIFKKTGLAKSIIFLFSSVFLYITACVIMYKSGVYTDIITVPLIVSAIFLQNLILKYVNEIITKKHMIKEFKKYIPDYVIDNLVANGNFEINLNGELRDVAVLFADIRNFTSMSESLEPETVVEILNEYLSLVTNAVFKNNGMLDKFIGDSAMAVFNAPCNTIDYEFLSISTAVDIIKSLDQLNEKISAKYGISISCGIGINCGKAVIGNIGSNIRMDYTAIGDTVNTASRIESMAKENQILISEDLFKRTGSRIITKNTGKFLLKGKTHESVLYEVVDIIK